MLIEKRLPFGGEDPFMEEILRVKVFRNLKTQTWTSMMEQPTRDTILLVTLKAECTWLTCRMQLVAKLSQRR
ncbi:hypothetical protein AHAS_Ahas20G0130900 [Arachis hypogaea]